MSPGLAPVRKRNMFEILKSMLTGQNAFATGGLLLMIIGGLSVYLRAVPEKLWHWFVDQTTMMITVKDDDAAFVWVKEWFLEQKFLRRIRRVDLDTILRNERIALIPAPGVHWFWYSGRPIQVWFSRSENIRERTARRVESLTFRTAGRNRDFLQRFVDDVVRCHTKRQGVQSYLYIYEDGWDHVEGYAPRFLESVVLDSGDKEDLLRDITRFRKSKQRYRRLGVPYHRGYLLYGPPGTGKTSLLSGLAAKFGMSIYAVNLIEFNDRTLKNAMNDVPENSMILFEDIDCMKAGNRRPEAEEWSRKQEAATGNQKTDSTERFSVTLSGLLNVLDGFHAPENVVFVMTTNKVEELDPALLRPGRIDYKPCMGEAAESQKIELYRRFFPDAMEIEGREFAEAHFAATMAE